MTTTSQIATMNLTFGTQVYGNDQGWGKLTQVAIDPTTQHVMELVVEQGLPFFKHNRVLPFTTISAVTEDAIQLMVDGGWDDYPEYREVAIEEPDPLASGQRLSSDGGIDYQVPLIQRRLRQGLEATRDLLSAGMTVAGTDGTIGKLDHLFVERAGGRLTHLALRRGFLQHEYIVVPVARLALGSEGQILLDTTTAAIAAMPHYQQRGEDAILVDLAQQLRAESTAFAHVQAQMVAGVVHLTGHVPSRALQVHAEELARTIPGIGAVSNEILVGNEPAPLPLAEPSDEVAAAVTYALTTDPRTKQSRITAVNEKGVIHLRGQVNSLAEKRLAENLAATQPGVTGVMNELTIQESHAPIREPIAA